MHEAEDHAYPSQTERPAVGVGTCRVEGSLVRNVDAGHERATVQEMTLAVEKGDAHGETHTCGGGRVE